MYVAELSLTDFRGYARAEVSWGPGATALVGANGAGKTNLVEAVAYLSTLGSHRVSSDAPLVRAGAQFAVVRAEVVRGGRRALLEVQLNPGRANRARVNRSPLPRARDLLGVLRCVVFAPEDLALVKGDPAGRRAFLDAVLVQRAPRLAGVIADYDRVLRQRNALLRGAAGARRGAAPETLAVWDDQLVALGADLLVARLRLVAELRPRVAAAYADVSGRPAAVEAAYASSAEPPAGHGRGTGGGHPWAPGEAAYDDPPPDVPAPDVPAPDRAAQAAALAVALDRRRGEELARGQTLVGPHRDDLLLRLGGLPARGYASHGESWSLALALRLASYGLLRDTAGDPGGAAPVLVLDDVFAELDTARRARLAGVVAAALDSPGDPQVLITAAVGEDLPPALDGARFRVADGTVLRA